MSEIQQYDVLVVGGGPVGSLAALLLAEQGLSVALVEQSTQVYPYPRAVSLDPFSLQTVARLLGTRFERLPYTPLHRAYYVLNKDNLTEAFAKAEITDPHLSMVNWFEQPILETLLREQIADTKYIQAYYGHEALLTYCDDHGVHLRHLNALTGKVDEVSGHYMLGCDGGGSFVRKQAGISLKQMGGSIPFLIVDCQIDRDKLRPLPEDFESGAFQIVDKKRPTTFIVMEAKNYGTLKRRVRFEFRLNPDDDFLELQSPAGLNVILAPFLDINAVHIQRTAVYKFNSMIANWWRKNNIFVCGDACHQTSPFTGQGLNMGIRHVASLITKISMVHNGHARPELLDRYQIENYDSALDVIQESLFLGKVLFNTTCFANTLRDSIHWFRGSGKNPLDILFEVLPKPMPLPDTPKTGFKSCCCFAAFNMCSKQSYRSSKPPRSSALSAYQSVRVRDKDGLNSYLMWNHPTSYRIICKEGLPGNLTRFAALPDSVRPMTLVLHPAVRSEVSEDNHFIVPINKHFDALFAGGLQYILMGYQYMMIGTYTAGQEDQMYKDFCNRFDLLCESADC